MGPTDDSGATGDTGDTAADSLRVVIAGGGTGGHLFPGIAVARELLERRPAARITFVGTRAGIESRVLPGEGFELDLVRSTGLKGKGWAERLRSVGLAAVGLVEAWGVIGSRRPDIVVGLGGYASGAIMLVAALRRVPTLVLEQNAVPGLTNRLLARWIDAAAVTYEGSIAYFHGKAFVAGNPVRREFQRAVSEGRKDESGGRVRVLVFGGSQGAHAINQAMVDAASRLAASGQWDLVHQTGPRDLETVREAYRRVSLEARVEPFLYDMGTEMRNAGLIVCRAGAGTIAELTVAGRPAILVPLPTAADDHQRRNADALQRAGAAVVIDPDELSADRLADVMTALGQDASGRRRMGEAATRLARPDAAARIADRVLALVRA